MQKIIKVCFPLFLVLILFSCTQKHTAEEYYGTWTLKEADSSINNMLEMGLVMILRLNEDGSLRIYYQIGTEKSLLNEGTWEFDEKQNLSLFTVPDQEYGGNINGKLILENNLLHYKTRNIDWIFE